jgi:hypothetical protein
MFLPTLSHYYIAIWKHVICVYKHTPKNVQDLKLAIIEEWNNLSQNFINKSINQWRGRLRSVVENNGGHIEHLF